MAGPVPSFVALLSAAYPAASIFAGCRNVVTITPTGYILLASAAIPVAAAAGDAATAVVAVAGIAAEARCPWTQCC